MKITNKIAYLLAATLLAGIVAFLLQPIPQSTSFHDFANYRSFASVPNFLNVITNLPFIFTAISGFIAVQKGSAPLSLYLMYSVLFLGVGLTAFGSAFYHTHPNNISLVWDRLPMTIIFMSLTSIVIAEFIDVKWGMTLLIPLLFIGAGSVLLWHYTEVNNHGDLRLYYLVQYFPMVFIPLTVWLYYEPNHKPAVLTLIWIVIWYVIAKMLERYDRNIYTIIKISGHSLKHLAAAASTWYFVVLYNTRYPSTSKSASSTF